MPTQELVPYQKFQLDEAMGLMSNPRAFKMRLDYVSSQGIAGERHNIGLALITADSRLLPVGNNIGLKFSGSKGGGKSTVAEAICNIHSPRTLLKISSLSEMSLLYTNQGNLTNKMIYVSEGYQLQAKKDTNTAYIIRSLLSEGSFIHYTTTGVGGARTESQIGVHGPISFLTTTIQDKLEAQLDDRLLTVHPDESSEQTTKIMMTAAAKAAGIYKKDDSKLMVWQLYHEHLKPVKVRVPFANDLCALIVKGNSSMPLALRRSHQNMLNAIMSVAAFHQRQREIDESGFVIAELMDYEIARQLLDVSGWGHYADTNFDDRYLLLLTENRPTKLNKLVGTRTKQAASQAAIEWVKADIAFWCDDQGNRLEGKALDVAKRSGQAYLIAKSNVPARLPSTYDLSNEARWKEGESLYEAARLN